MRAEPSHRRCVLFRDHPAVWHAFGFFTAVFVFAITAAFSLEDGAAASALVPLTATLLVLVAVGLFRGRMSAFGESPPGHPAVTIADAADCGDTRTPA